MVEINSDQVITWVLALMLPLVRILSFIASCPFFNHRSIPQHTKVAFGLILAMIVAPTLPNVPNVDVLSLIGITLIAQQVLIGIAMGFMLRIIFAAFDMAGQLISMTMGLGFATFFDPQSRGQSMVVSQLFVMLATLIFLAFNGHLLVISGIVVSFQTMPIGFESEVVNGLTIAMWGGRIFSVSLQIAMPVIGILLLTNFALGVLSRSSPQLNLFGIGFPITLFMGFLVVTVMLPTLTTPIENILKETIDHMQRLII